jgi:hypothetical protein
MMLIGKRSLAFQLIALLLTAALLSPLPLFSREKKIRSNKATVFYQDSAYKGTLVYVDSELLVLREKNSERLLGFAFPEVARIKIKKSRAGVGILVGLGVGVALATVLVASATKSSDNSIEGLLLLPVVIGLAIGAGIILSVFTAASGGLFGVIFGAKNFKLAKMNPEKKERALEKLKKYALLAELPEETRALVVMAGK